MSKLLKLFAIVVCYEMRIENRTQAFEWYHFQLSWTTHTLDFKVMPLFDAEYLRNGTRYWHSYNKILGLIGTYTCPILLLEGVISNDLEWLWVTWRNIQWHKASRGFSATAEFLVLPVMGHKIILGPCRNRHLSLDYLRCHKPNKQSWGTLMQLNNYDTIVFYCIKAGLGRT